MSIKLSNVYKRCKCCGCYIPRRIWDNKSKKTIKNYNDLCPECKAKEKGDEE